jgi:hypothetical protein
MTDWNRVSHQRRWKGKKNVATGLANMIFGQSR